jgi:hypothetical protein
MAGPIGRITAAMAAVHNENSAALASLNFDFTLVKLEAPVEYTALGATISRKRKVDAEEGALHRTARQLGALFEDILPLTDDLFRAYGKRVSEISSIPAINPTQTSDRGGIFANHIGADTTSIWAAVTSGSSAIAVHLLGCMLARIFTGPEAISVWVEIIQRRKDLIRGKQESSLYSNENGPAIVAAKQDISRENLACWDASARAWLQSADQAKEFQHKQAMLILSNASVPVNHECETYTSVTKAWIAALEAMNSLVKGIPQRVQDGVALLAISSWHLYPNMVVFGKSHVQMKDPIFESSALLTLGLEHAREGVESVYWSLPLACLQYYGHPVQTSRSIGQENARIKPEQFLYVLLGCVFAGWDFGPQKNYASTNKLGFQWLGIVEEMLKIDQASLRERQNLTWLTNLCTAAKEFAHSEDSEQKSAEQLMNLGRRRSTFLNSPSETPPPLFGLTDLSILIPLLINDECRIQLLRRICHHFKLDRPECLIKYCSSEQQLIEYASIVRLKREVPFKRTHEGVVKQSSAPTSIYVRWLSMTPHQLSVYNKRSGEFKDLGQLVRAIQILEGPVLRWGGEGKRRRESRDELEKLQLLKAIFKRRQQIEAMGELCVPVAIIERDSRYIDERGDEGLLFSSAEDFVAASRELEHRLGACVGKPREAVSQIYVVGDPYLAAFVKTKLSVATPQFCPLDLVLGRDCLEGFLLSENFDLEKLYGYLSAPFSQANMSTNTFSTVKHQITGLKACAKMANIYKLLPGATISTLVLNKQLNKSKWVLGTVRVGGFGSPLTLAEAFACVAMFESGSCNLDPGTLSEAFAMSSGNSLYIAGSLLCDPYEQPGPSEIRRVVGNIGRAGITFLISPPEVKNRQPDPEKWMEINHNAFNGMFEDHFQHTSIHLSFTRYEISLITEDNPRHIIDRAVALVETLVSVYDSGTWFGEIDILDSFKQDVSLVTCPGGAHHLTKPTYLKSLKMYPQLTATSIENWDELIEAPSTGTIAVRAHGNWLARLATMAVCVKHGFRPVIMGDHSCWICCAAMLPFGEGDARVALIC